MTHITKGLTVIVCITGLLLPAQAPAAELLDTTGDATAPPLDLVDLHGRQHSLDDYAGKVLLVNFWASWCTPCITEMPGMQRLSETLEDQPFEILAINVSESENRVREFIKRMNLNMTILLDHNGNTFEAWQGKVLPASFLLDRTGRIRYQIIGPLEWDSDEAGTIIEELLKHH